MRLSMLYRILLYFCISINKYPRYPMDLSVSIGDGWFPSTNSYFPNKYRRGHDHGKWQTQISFSKIVVRHSFIRRSKKKHTFSLFFLTIEIFKENTSIQKCYQLNHFVFYKTKRYHQVFFLFPKNGLQ